MLPSQAKCSALAQRFSTVLSSLLTVILLAATVCQPAQSQTYKVIYNFTGQGNDGATPYGGPTLDSSGNLYGTTYLGGTSGNGTVYRLSPQGSSWTFTSLYNFKGVPDGSGPAFGSLVIGGNRALFGTTEGGGDFGTAFAICACPGREIVVHRFGQGTDGAQPIGGVVPDSRGNIYGTTSLGGAYGNGTVFEAKRTGQQTWNESAIYSFTGGTDAINPVAGVSLDAEGNLYGTAPAGGANGNGAVFKLTRSSSGWTETVLYSFQGQSDGQNPVGGVVVDSSGNLYGTTFDGGINGGGTVYEMSPSGGGWTFTVLYSFTGGYGGPYNKLAFDAKGNIYGITNGEGANGLGSVFKLTPGNSGWTFTDLYDFPGGGNGASPYGSVAVDSLGNVFGTAAVGGSSNQGLVFEITP